MLADRSSFERDVLREALKRDLPVLGVCGGMQLLNVVQGGTLFQDAALRPGTDEQLKLLVSRLMPLSIWRAMSRR